MRRPKRVFPFATFFLAGFLLLAAAGCSRVNQENYDKLSFGMQYEAAVDILGEPDSCESIFSGKSCIWGNESKNINMKIVAGKVVFLSSKGL